MNSITLEVRTQIESYIQLLNAYLNDNPKDFDIREWIPNCVECLQFALDNEKILEEKPSLYADTLSTLNLLYEWIVEGSQYAYIILRKKFETVHSPEEVGKALKTLVDRMRAEHHRGNLMTGNDFVSFIDDDGNCKSTEQILSECSALWGEMTNNEN